MDSVAHVIAANDRGLAADRNRALVGDFAVLVVGLIRCRAFDLTCRLWVVRPPMKVLGWDFPLPVIIVICGVGVEFGTV